MESSTKMLRRLLDERGVEWGDDGYPTTCTVWESDGIVWHGLWRDDCIELIAHLTPEQAIAATLGTGTCEADETDLIPFVRADSGDFEVDYIHVMECSSCGGTYEYVNGSYEFLPPKYCPNCGRRVEQ